MSSPKKRKTDSSTQSVGAGATRLSAYVVQSIGRHDSYADREYDTHGVFSTTKDANEAARRLFNKLGKESYGGDLAPVTTAHLTNAHAGLAKARTGSVWRIGQDGGDDDGDGEGVYGAPREIAFVKDGTVRIELGDLDGGEEVKVWVLGFGMDGNMPEEEKARERAVPREDIVNRGVSRAGWNYPPGNYPPGNYLVYKGWSY